MRKITLLAAILGVCLSTGYAALEDTSAPEWRGQSGTTYQDWDFVGFPTLGKNNNVYGVVADNYINDNGDPLLDYLPGYNQEWVEEYNGRTGVLPLSGNIEIDIPNFINSNPYKEIIVQLVWAPQSTGNVPTVWETLTGTDSQILGSDNLANGWIHSTYMIQLWPNPEFETVRIDGGIMVDSVIVDTICTVPEPATMSLLGLGGLALLRRKK